ncbi:VanZ family protein [Paenibacillus sp. D2_2]|uniref:VanZ family protein n=1 Tax=Paenibacillus sp. D2_2 TaxID=3073092 RepID=UPI002814B19C|nr:VanZ family protein [Paenibacillus sp. D2_2]WMT41658.1 VanZ family protein [Paenibacillus sp. D2_2]
MLQSYLFPIKYAFFSFPFVAFLFTMPFLIVQYRKYGYINKFRSFLLYLFLLYLMNAYFLVILPLPASRHNLPMAAGGLQWMPLNFIHDILKETGVVISNPSSYLHLLKERAFLQVLFNIFLTVPFGMMLRYYYRLGWLRCIVYTFLLSLFFELTQLTGLYGIYRHPYRVFDVDDLLMNTLGGIVGVLIADWCSSLLPNVERLDADVNPATKRVTYLRRGIAYMIDFCIWSILEAILAQPFHLSLSFFLSTGIYFMLLPYLTGGYTFGKWIVRIKLIRTGEKPRISLLSLFVRYGILYWLIFAMHQIIPNMTNNLHPFIAAGSTLAIFAVDVAFFIHVVIYVIRKKPQLFYEKISGTKHVVAWEPREEQNQENNQTSI